MGWEDPLLPLCRQIILGRQIPTDAGYKPCTWRLEEAVRGDAHGLAWTPNQYWLNLIVRYAAGDPLARALLLLELRADAELYGVPRFVASRLTGGIVELPRDRGRAIREVGIRPRPAEQSPHYEDFYCLGDLAALVHAQRTGDELIARLVAARWGRRKALMMAFAAEVDAGRDGKRLRVVWCGNRAAEPMSAVLDAWAYRAHGIPHERWMYRDNRVRQHADDGSVDAARSVPFGGGVWAVAAKLLPEIPTADLDTVRLPYPVERSLPWGPTRWQARIAPAHVPPPTSPGRVCRVEVEAGKVTWQDLPGEKLHGETVLVGGGA